jgi:hypothetical protein
MKKNKNKLLVIFLFVCFSFQLNAQSIFKTEEERLNFWAGRLISSYLISENNFESTLLLSISDCFIPFLKENYTNELIGWEKEDLSSSEIFYKHPKIKIKISECYNSLILKDNKLTIDELGYLFIEFITHDYHKMDSIAQRKNLEWLNNEKVYFNADTKEVLIISYENRKINIFISSRKIETYNYYRNDLINRGFSPANKEINGSNIIESFPVKFGGYWILQRDDKNKHYGIQLFSAEFSSDFLKIETNKRVNKY